MSSSRSLLLLLLTLAGCGFSPLYGGGGATAGALDTVEIANIPERTGQLLRQSLQTDFYAAGAPVAQRYVLNVTYAVSQADIGVQADTATTRARSTATATWSLAPVGEPTHQLASGQVVDEDASNIVANQLFAFTLESDAVNDELSSRVAADITAQVAAYFHAHPAA